MLVVSDELTTLTGARVHTPLAALQRRGVIGGYAIVRHGALEYDTQADDGLRRFSVLWIQRGRTAQQEEVIKALSRPFVYDIDDNLLALPTYRPAVEIDERDVISRLINSAAVVSCSTARLAALLELRIPRHLGPRLVITPNLGRGQPMTRRAGSPQAVIWASSDNPALSASRPAITAAIRDFCLTHRARLVSIGSPPPLELVGSGIALESIGILPPSRYIDTLRQFSPSILIAPLETTAEPETQAFVDGKSDVKMVEALTCGLVGVFSRAAPYLDSDVTGAILVENTRDAWLAGLEAARRACLTPVCAPWLPHAREAAGLGGSAWAQAIAHGVGEPFSLSDVLAKAKGGHERQTSPSLSNDDQNLNLSPLSVMPRLSQRSATTHV